MAAVYVTFPCESDSQAAEVAAAIREAGILWFTGSTDESTVNITVGDVQVST
jgi:hypothetical protein